MVTHPSDFCGTSGGSNLFVVFGVAHIFFISENLLCNQSDLTLFRLLG